MPRVPYQPYSDVAPSGANVNIATPPEAFGVGVAKATEQLGGELEKGGNELFSRAVAMQQLTNETEAQQADLRLMDKAGELHANYNALQGEERVKAYPQYRQSLLDLQANIRSSLSNDMARRMYDRSSLSTIGRTIFNGAGAAASAQREWYGNTAAATMDMAVKTVGDDPTNDILFAQKRSEIIAASNKVAYAKHGVGPDDPIAQDLALKGVSSAWRSRITSVAHVDPPQASQLEDEAVKRKELTEQDKLFLDNTIRAQTRAIWGGNIARDTYEAGSRAGKTLKQMEDEVRDKATKQNPNDPVLADHAVQALKGEYNQDKYAARQDELTNRQVIMDAITSRDVRSEQELYADPRVATARDNLPASAWKTGIPAMINRLNEAKNKITNRDNWVELEGMKENNPIKFLDQDISKWQLSTQDMKYFIHQQELKMKNTQADPRVQQAIGWMRQRLGAEMRAAGVYSAPTKAEGAAAGSDWDKFTGLVSIAIQEEIKATGKPPKYKEITEEIGPRVLKDVSEPYLFGLLSSDVPYFKKNIQGDEYEAFKKSRTQEAIDKNDAVPTDTQLERMYRQMDYVRFYGKRKDAQ